MEICFRCQTSLALYPSFHFGDTLRGTCATQRPVYGMTSLPAEEVFPEQLLLMLRSYWRIESGLHYRLDVTLHEDQTRFKKHSAAHPQ